MSKKDLKVSRKANAGFRDGINKEDLIKSLTDDDIERIKLWKELENKDIKNEDAYKCGIHSDQLYKQFLEKINIIRESTRLILQSQNHVKKNKIDIIKGSTERKFPDTNAKMGIRDLEQENYKINITIDKNINDLRTLLYGVYADVGVQRLDRVVYFTEEDYVKLMAEVKDGLAKEGVDLYKKAI